MLNEQVAQLYADLDGGFSHAAWLLPTWVPLPSFRLGLGQLTALYLLLKYLYIKKKDPQKTYCFLLTDFITFILGNETKLTERSRTSFTK